MTSSESRRESRIEVFDCLRGFAAIGVVLYHYIGNIAYLGESVSRTGAAIFAISHYGQIRVPIFFALSGCVIAMTANRYTFAPRVAGRFLMRRMLRIAPPYWTMIILTSLVLMAGKLAGYFDETELTASQVTAHLLFAQDIFRYPTLNVAYWTLCLDVQFYAAFTLLAVALHRSKRESLPFIVWAMSICSVAVDLAALVPNAWLPRLWYQFGFGLIAYYAAIRQFPRLLFHFTTLAVGLIGIGSGDVSFVATPVVAEILFAFTRENAPKIRFPRVVLSLGAISYSLYLVHGLVGKPLTIGFRSVIRTETMAWSAIAICFAAALAFAALFYKVSECRSIEWSRKYRIDPAPDGIQVPREERRHTEGRAALATGHSE